MIFGQSPKGIEESLPEWLCPEGCDRENPSQNRLIFGALSVVPPDVRPDVPGSAIQDADRGDLLTGFLKGAFRDFLLGVKNRIDALGGNEA